MSIIEILVPDLPESVINATVTKWIKNQGDYIHCDEVIVEIETDKVILEVPSSTNGILETIIKEQGAVVTSGEILGRIKHTDIKEDDKKTKNDCKKSLSSSAALKEHDYLTSKDQIHVADKNLNKTFSPTVRRLISEYELKNTADIKGSGVGGRVTRQDLQKIIAPLDDHKNPENNQSKKLIYSMSQRDEKRVPMTRLRQRIAERLLEAKNSTAMLTTFNEVNMYKIIKLRKEYGNLFEKKHNIKLGFMSFYVKAVIEMLKDFPEINAYIDGNDIIYHNYFDISIAVSTARGLITPVLKDIDKYSFAGIEKKIKFLALKGQEGKLTVEELKGGNFTITNGGVFGSLMSTPIINPPQSAILGMHAIKDRPMAVNGEVIILPMMYLALSYDHRLIDGREAVGCLIKLKNILEDPIRLLLDV